MLTDGTTIDNRYKILRRVGSGGMADVYLAEDQHLHRQVALKVMHQQLAADPEFVQRFEREAQSAAGLQHKNVVNVFDRGQVESTYYIAMEYLPGRSLKDVIRAMGALDPRLAIHIAVQILDAARFAHAKGVVHRDIKPQNVMIDDEWNVKVTDFGIAHKPLSDVTQTGMMLGTAQYISPEQAQGQPVTAASDLYSIGVVLFEMLTGRLPFEGDSSVATALKHISEPPPRPTAITPSVPPVLEEITLRALAKHPAQRFRSAEEFSAALENARGRLAEPAGRTEVRTAATSVAPPAAVAVTEEAPVDAERERKWWVILAAAAALLLAALLAFLLLRGEPATVPDVVGRSVGEAQSRLAQAGFESEVFRQRNDAPVDEVFSQSPTGGAQLDKGKTVILNVSSGPGEVEVPDVEGLSRKQAEQRLESLGLKVEARREYSDDVEEGRATRTVPESGDKAERGSVVNLYLSRGPRAVGVPDVDGMKRDEAVKKLEDAGFEVEVSEEDGSEEKDTVTDQSPAAGKRVKKGSTVELTVASGFNDVPLVSDLDPEDAEKLLEEAGFTARRVETDTAVEEEDGIVIGQNPIAQTRREVGTEVEIEIGNYVPSP